MKTQRARAPWFCSVLAALVLSACGGGGGDGGSGGAPAPTPGTLSSITITSTNTGFTYPIDIYLPPSYASSTTRYPVIYATDGDAAEPPQGKRFLNFRDVLQRRNIEAILVGVGGTANRNTDYLLPGAEAYHRFLTLELIPRIEAQVRADPARRMLSGTSFGGSFVITAFFLEAPTATLAFSHYISAEGAFQLPSFVALESQACAAIGTAPVPATLILARGIESPATNSVYVDEFYRRMAGRHLTGLTLIETSFSADHVGTDIPSFGDAMARIFD